MALFYIFKLVKRSKFYASKKEIPRKSVHFEQFVFKRQSRTAREFRRA